MKIDDTFGYFEDIEFEFKIDHASSFDEFISILVQDTVFENFLTQTVDPTSAQAVADHIKTLLKVEADPQFAHPHDASMAVYILALTETHPKLIKFLLTDGPPVEGLFWARFAAKTLQNELQVSEKQVVDEEQ